MKKIIQLSAMLLATSGFVLATQAEAPKASVTEKVEAVKKTKKISHKSHKKDRDLTEALNMQTGPYVAQATIVVPVCEKAKKDEHHDVKTHKKGRKKSHKKIEAKKKEVKDPVAKDEAKSSVVKDEAKSSVVKEAAKKVEETKNITAVKEDAKKVEPSVVPAAPAVAPAAPAVPK